MHYRMIKANDGCELAYQISIPLESYRSPVEKHRSTVILLIHGFSGSSAYFRKNFEALSANSLVVAIDLRGHGKSGRPTGGYHVARLAMDLQEVVRHITTTLAQDNSRTRFDIVPVGCSIGAAVLWTYVELFSDDDFAGMAFVDQAPLQDRSNVDEWNAYQAHRGCYNEATMLAAQKTWMGTPEAAYRGLVRDCLGYRFAPQDSDNISDDQLRDDEGFFTGVSRECNPVWLAKLLADHTRYDHREACEEIVAPVLVMAGRRTGCFPLEGIKETYYRIRRGHHSRGMQSIKYLVQWVEFESGHWLFWEEPELFNEEILKFAQICERHAVSVELMR